MAFPTFGLFVIFAFPWLCASSDSLWPQFLGNGARTGQSTVAYSGSFTLLWTYEPPSGVIKGAPVIGSDGTLFVPTSDGIAALDTKGNAKWKFNTEANVESSPAVTKDNIIYVTCTNQRVYALDGNTGEEIWNYIADAELFTPPTIGIDNIVYVTPQDQYLYALDGTNGLTYLADLISSILFLLLH